MSLETVVEDIREEANARAKEITEDAEAEVMSLLPRNAVGEPFQSEGDA